MRANIHTMERVLKEDDGSEMIVRKNSLLDLEELMLKEAKKAGKKPSAVEEDMDDKKKKMAWHHRRKPLGESLVLLLGTSLWMWVLASMHCVGQDGPLSPQRDFGECFWERLVDPGAYIVYGFWCFIATFALDTLFIAMYPALVRGTPDPNGPLPSTRWFFCHFVVNGVISSYAFIDVKACFTKPNECGVTKWEGGTEVMGLAVALHFYHIVFFNLQAGDWLHHGMTALLTTPPILLCQQTRTISFALFFMTGLPGGLDYLLLTCVKLGWLHSIVEKQLYVVLTVWIRGPGVIAGAVLSMDAVFNEYYRSQYTWVVFLGIVWNMIICYWNGMYFMHCTLSDYYRPGRARVAS